MRVLVGLVASLVVVGCGPLWMIPGGELAGNTEPVPGEWAFSHTVETVQLETRPDDPYSVNIWGVGVGEHFYVAAGDMTSTWAQNVAANPDVRLKVSDSLYEMSAVRVEDDNEIEACLAAIKRKYDFEPDPEQRENATVFRLEARAPAS